MRYRVIASTALALGCLFAWAAPAVAAEPARSDADQVARKARDGSGQVVGIVGEAGVGKSRLILELRKAISKDEYTCLQGLCLRPQNKLLRFQYAVDSLAKFCFDRPKLC